MDKQQVFDKVAKHLLTQNAKSMAPYDGGYTDCAYRGRGGLMCAVGCLIADEHYSSDLEGAIASAGSVRAAVERSGITDHEALLMLSGLQRIHDDYDPFEWAGKLRAFAKAAGLEYKEAEYVATA